jgi:hypothetical protein
MPENFNEILASELEQGLATDVVVTETEHKEAVEARPVHRLEGILSMQQRTLDQAIAHRKEFEVIKNTNLQAVEASFREQIDACDQKIATMTETLLLLQQDKQRLQEELVKRRQEVIDRHNADDEALMKIIKAQRMVINALGDEYEPRPNGATRPNRPDDQEPESGEEK